MSLPKTLHVTHIYHSIKHDHFSNVVHFPEFDKKKYTILSETQVCNEQAKVQDELTNIYYNMIVYESHSDIASEEMQYLNTLKKCLELNKRFFTFHRKKRPYVILKWAESKDGFIAPIGKRPFWLTNSYSKQIVHKLRSEEDSILIGVQTAIDDNPKLTTRLWSGKNPKRIVIDPNNRMLKNCNLKNAKAETYILKKKNGSNFSGNESLNFIIPIDEILSFLYEKNIQSVLIEGGAKTISFFINQKVWDEALVFKTDNEIKKGIRAPKIEIKERNETIIKEDKLFQFLNT